MHKAALILFTVILVLALTGCSNSHSAVEMTATSNPNAVAGPDFLAMTACQTWDAVLSGPSELYSGDQLPGWEERPIYDLEYYIGQCERVAWGPYERGPVFILFESQRIQDPPESCFDGDGETTFQKVFGAIWLSDPDLARFANATYGIPSRYANFNLTWQIGMPVEPATWTWGPPDVPPSELRFYEQDLDETGSDSAVRRYYWDNGKGVSFLEIEEHTGFDQFQIPLVIGTFQSPTLAARSGVEYHAGLSGVAFGGSMKGHVEQFGDYQCTKPL